MSNMQIIQDFISKGRRNRPGHAMTPRYITCHDSANVQIGADAAAHARYLKNTPNLLAGWHYTVCDKAIYQHLPLNENGWHAGDTANGPGNRQSIGIEICENKDGNRAQAEKNAAWLVAKLLKDFNLPITAVKQHYDWSKKNCPRVLRGRPGGWQGFIEQVKAELAKMTVPGDVEITQLRKEIEQLKQERDRLAVELGIAGGKIADAVKIHAELGKILAR